MDADLMMNSSCNKTTGVLPLQRALCVYYLTFFAFALLMHSSASTSPLLFMGWQPPALLPAMLTAWLGATIGIALVLLFSRELENKAGAKNHNRVFFFLLGGIFLDGICNFAAMKWAGDASEYGASGVLRRALIATANLGILMAASGAGLLVARGLKAPTYLVMAAIVGAVTDIFSVYAGPSKQVLSSSVFPYLGFQWGIWGEGVIPCVGAGDFIFLSLYFAGARRFHLSERKTFIAMSAAFGLGYLSLFFVPNGVPALPFMAALLLLVHARELKRQIQSPPIP